MQKCLKYVIALFVLAGIYFFIAGIMSLNSELALKLTARLAYGQVQILTSIVWFGFSVLFGIFGSKTNNNCDLNKKD